MSDQQYPNSRPDEVQVYQIRIKGHLGILRTGWFEEMTVTSESNGETVLTGALPDQAMLHKILRQIRDLGVPLIAVTRLPIDEDSSE